MTAQSNLSQLEELTSLRARVAELERLSEERNRTDVALKESRRLFDTFLSHTPAVAWMKDDRGRYVFANRRFLDFVSALGCTCIGSTDHDLWPASVADLMQAHDRAAHDGAAVKESVEVLPSPAGNRTFRVHRFAFHAKSGSVYTGGIGVDITNEEAARQKAVSMLSSLQRLEARSQRLFQSELVGIMECSGDVITDANDALLGWLGYTLSEIAASPLSWRVLTPERFRARDDEALLELQSSGSWRSYEKELIDREGKPMPVVVGATATGCGPGSFLCFVLNITERKQMESRLLRSQKLESLGLIAGGVAHDFNNLLATIMGNASLSLDAVAQEHPAFRPLNEVVIASRRASDLTQQVLAYSGRANIAIKPVDLSITVKEIGSLLETTISKKINLIFDLDNNLPAIDGDEGHLQQVIMNLVINASDAIGEQPGDIIVCTRAAEAAGSGGRGVCFEVHDTGCGMDEQTKARIFDPFFTTKATGRGLGLAAVVGIVSNHHGTLLVESTPGVGTTFRATFPAGKEAPVCPPPAAARNELWGSETILVADDDEGIRRMTKVALERFGYKVLIAADGKEAVDIFEAHHRDIAVVLLDWAMPVMNGEEALMRMLETDASATVVMSSGYAETETLQRVGTPLLAGFVQKPYTTTQLAQRLREVIDQAA